MVSKLLNLLYCRLAKTFYSYVQLLSLACRTGVLVGWSVMRMREVQGGVHNTRKK